jgi:uncharacterized protein YndB with AHSA1/START domain
MSKERYQLEYPINASPKLIFSRLSTPGGLNEWFADNVSVRGKFYTFEWGKESRVAELTAVKDLRFVRFHWLDDDDENSFFEFRLNTEELTGDIALVIIDFAEPGELDEAKELWDAQIADLKHNLGA